MNVTNPLKSTSSSTPTFAPACQPETSYLYFGVHANNSFPIQQPKEFALYTTCDPDSRENTYHVDVMQYTNRNGRRYGWLNYRFHAPTIEKANLLIRDLRKQNIKWASSLAGITVIPNEKKIRLLFHKGGGSLEILGKVESVNGKMIFKMFSEALRLTSQDYKIEDSRDSEDVLYLTFDDHLDPEVLKSKMKDALTQLHSVHAKNSVPKLLKDADPSFRMDMDPRDDQISKLPEIEDLGLSSPLNRGLIFDITETSDTGSNLFTVDIDKNAGGGLRRAPKENYLSIKDIPFLLQNHETAPRKQN